MPRQLEAQQSFAAAGVPNGRPPQVRPRQISEAASANSSSRIGDAAVSGGLGMKSRELAGEAEGALPPILIPPV